MGELKIVMPDDLERAFRKAAMKRFGFRKGSMSEAAREAIYDWSADSNEDMHEEGQSWDSLVGVMKHIKKSSVQLQHEIGKILTKKNVNRR